MYYLRTQIIKKKKSEKMAKFKMLSVGKKNKKYQDLISSCKCSMSLQNVPEKIWEELNSSHRNCLNNM